MILEFDRDTALQILGWLHAQYSAMNWVPPAFGQLLRATEKAVMIRSDRPGTA